MGCCCARAGAFFAAVEAHPVFHAAVVCAILAAAAEAGAGARAGARGWAGSKARGGGGWGGGGWGGGGWGGGAWAAGAGRWPWLALAAQCAYAVFAVEMVVKIGAEGTAPRRFFLDPWCGHHCAVGRLRLVDVVVFFGGAVVVLLRGTVVAVGEGELVNDSL